MAKAQKTTRKVPVVTTTYTEETMVELMMTYDEAQTLRDVLGKVGGRPQDTRRLHADSISVALTDAGVKRKFDVPWDWTDCTGAIEFHNEPRNPRYGR